MSLTENSNQVFLPGGATNSQNSPYISDWPLDQGFYYDISPILQEIFSLKIGCTNSVLYLVYSIY